ncbi:MAG: dihydroorotate dehydrogenase [Armatimonadetes bacterium]|nr:dihydroorotate dehydrogenase [Armatimonadota bacterium]MDW8122727.1 dihydroorotate dehydrogenase [Armatimonadota bacterium]
MRDPDLTVTVSGIRLRTPLILASGCCGYGKEMERIEGWDWSAVGAVVLKGITLEPRLGHPPHRVAEVASGMINSIGLQNVGLAGLVQLINEELHCLPVPLIANVAGRTVEEYQKICDGLKKAPSLAAVELNISSPNIRGGGIEFGRDPEMAAQVVQACKEVWTKPLWVKLSPEPDRMVAIAQACVEAGADALTLCNTFPALTLNSQSLFPRPILSMGFGGLSGPAIKPIILRKAFLVCRWLREQSLRTPVIGSGGVWTGRDVLEYLAVGCHSVQLGTVLFADPLAPQRIARELKDYIKKVVAATGQEQWLNVESFRGVAMKELSECVGGPVG